MRTAAAALALVATLGCGRGTGAGAGTGSGSVTGSGSGSVTGTGTGTGAGSGSGTERRPSETRPESKGPPDAGVTLAAGPPPGTLDPVRIPDTTTQLVVATTLDWNETGATVWFFQRKDARAPWRRAAAPWSAVIGRTGMAWGRGAHGDGPPPGHDGPRKHEGDGRSPAGLFAIGPAFGYDAKPPRGARLPYTTATDTWRCVDDPASAHYNRLLDESTVTPDWSSREELRRDDELYRWVVEIRHNPDGNPGSGSCIFLHVWSGPGSSTAGCTAMAEPLLSKLLARLDPAAHPMFVLLTAREYTSLAKPWALPSLER